MEIIGQSQIEDIKLASRKMTGCKRRQFFAAMTNKYCEGKSRVAEKVFGWNRNSVELGLNELSSGFKCHTSLVGRSGRKMWEDLFPEAAEFLRKVAEAHSQQDPTFNSTVAYTRLTAASARQELIKRGYSNEKIPSERSMSDILNRMGYRLRTVIKAKPLKKIPDTDNIFDNVKDKGGPKSKKKRLSIDCKATVKPGEFSRNGECRGLFNKKASDHDFAIVDNGKYTPCGIVDEDSGDLFVNIGSSFKTSDFIVDSLELWWKSLSATQQSEIDEIQLKMDNGPESSGSRTQFLKRITQFSDNIGIKIQLLYFPPYHSKYNPIERCWGILEKHWNGALLYSSKIMVQWLKSMTWKGINPIVNLSEKIYEKGISLSNSQMKSIEERLIRNKNLPKYDILINPILI